MSESSGTVTVLLQAWRDGHPAAFEQLVRAVYGKLHGLAAAHLRAERAHHTWSPTDLVSEAYLSLFASGPVVFDDRLQLFSAASRRMRNILVDHARKRRAERRGGGVRPDVLDEEAVGAQRSEQLLALDESLERLARHDERKAQITELHYFGGLTAEEIATVYGIHVNTVSRDLSISKRWLGRSLSPES